MFDHGKLVGFIINGIDRLNGELVAFNTGTGVIKEYRGNQIVDKLYSFAIPELKINGINKCSLEVIQKNDKAIRVYERIGFKKSRALKCFKGELKFKPEKVKIQEIKYEEIEKRQNINHKLYTWDNSNEAIKISKEVYKNYKVGVKESNDVGFFIINSISGYLPQFEITAQLEKKNWKKLFSGIQSVSKYLKINNVDIQREELIEEILRLGLENYIDQYEMEMSIN